MQRGGAAIPSGTCDAARRDIDLVAADSGRMAVNLVCGCSRREVASGRRPARTRRDWRPGAQASAIVARRDVGAIVAPPTVRVRITHDPHRRRRTRHRTVAGSLRSPRLNTAERRPRDSTPFMRISPSCRSRGGNGGWRGPDPSFAGTVVGEPVTSWTSLPRAGPRNTGSVSACGKPEAIQVAATRRTSVALPALQSPRRVRFPPAGVPKSVAGSATVAASSRSSARA